jgi:predicted AAA+ superfamily ATPase
MNVPPKRICRFQFEEKLIMPKEEDLEAIVRVFLKNILGEDIHTSERVYFFFDEIQFVEGWQGVLKKYYDLNKNLKFFISGSASLFIKKKTKESLAGRTFEESVPPLSFGEYLAIGRRGRVEGLQVLGDIFSLGKHSIEELRVSFAKNMESAPPEFERYVAIGQFPEAIGLADPVLVQKYIVNSVITKVTEYDLPKLFGFRKTEELGLLLSVLARETGNILEYGNISSEAGIANNTLKEYVGAFSDSYLHDIIFNHTKKHRESRRQLKKGYIASPNIACAVMGLREENFRNNPVVGHLVETAMFNRLHERYEDISFWNERGREVDFVIISGGSIVPVEVKYKEAIGKKDYDGLCSFMTKKKVPCGVMLSKNQLDIVVASGCAIYVIPAWMI